MAKARSHHPEAARGNNAQHANDDDDEDTGLLAARTGPDDDAGGGDDHNRSPGSLSPLIAQPSPTVAASSSRPGRRQQRPQQLSPRPALHSPALSSGSRTPGRVRFDLTPTVVDNPVFASQQQQQHQQQQQQQARRSPAGFQFPLFSPSSRDSMDSMDSFDVDSEPENAAGEEQRRLLLTEIEAPAVALANSGRSWGGSGRRRASSEGGWTTEGDDDEDGDGDYNSTDVGEHPHDGRPKSSLRSAFMNMANSIIGAGIIGQPYAFKQAGLLAGVLLLVGLTVVVDWTICLIVINSKLSGANSFQGTVERCFGRTGLVAISLAQWAFAFGGMVAFGVIVGDSIPHVLLAIWPNLAEYPLLGALADRRVVIVIFTMGVSYPLTLYRDISKLAKASTLALVSMAVIVVTVVVQGALTPREARGSFTTPLLTVNSGISQAIGVISFGMALSYQLPSFYLVERERERERLTTKNTAFVCHHNSLLIYGSLKTPTIDRFSRVTHFSTGVSMLACLILALAGFLTFGDKTVGNVLNNFPSDNTMVTVARLCFGLNMLTTLPLEAFVCREVMMNYFWPTLPGFSLRLHLALSTGLVVSAMVLSLLTCDLGVIFELVGSTSACAMAYILPPLCYIKLATRSWRTYVAMAVVAFGCAVMAISLVQAVGKIISGEFPSFFSSYLLCRFTNTSTLLPQAKEAMHNACRIFHVTLHTLMTGGHILSYLLFSCFYRNPCYFCFSDWCFARCLIGEQRRERQDKH